MHTQYTIRKVPDKLDKFLRRQAKMSGKSLNQTVLEYMSQAAKLDMQSQEDDFSWLIGSNTIDQASLDAIAEMDKADKARQSDEMHS